MKRIIPILMLVAALVASGYWLGQHNQQNTLPVIQSGPAKEIFVCPMHPNVVQDHPGTCPICGMDLVHKGQDASSTQIHVDTATQQKFGVRLATAEVTSLAHEIRTYATLTEDLNKARRITPTVMGTIVKLHATYPGQYIAAGAPLYEIYSEDLQNLENEYVDYSRRREQTLKAVEETRARNMANMGMMGDQDPEHKKTMIKQVEDQLESLALPSRRDGERLTAKLKLAGLTDDMLKKLASTHQAWETIVVRARQNCTVTDIKIREGMTVSPSTELLSCAESGNGWMDVVFYPDQADYIHEGDLLDIEFDDGSIMQTRLTGLSLVVNGNSRTFKAHIPVRMPAGIRFGDYAEVTLHSSSREVLTVPVSAVIRSGKGNYVMKFMGNGHFMPQPVKTGMYNDSRIGIISGLSAGDQVAVNGQFLLDSAASIAESAERFKQGN